MSSFIVRPETEKPRLSEFWNQAAIELNQIKGYFGNPDRKEACAYGALCYYSTGGKGSTPSDVALVLGYPSLDRLMEDTKSFEKKVAEKIGRKNISIFTLNDEHSWTFRKFADMAKELGF